MSLGIELKIKNRFKLEIVYINILIGLLFIMMLAVAYQTAENKIDNISIEVDNTASEVETRIRAAAGSVLYLHAAAGEIYKNRDLSTAYAEKVHNIDAQGDYALDIPELLSNLTGFGGVKSSKQTIHEMASSLALTRYFKIVKGLNKSFVRVYYASNHHFSTSYPYVWSDQFMWNAAMLEKSLWQNATPHINPEGNLFFTSLHKEVRNKSPLVTIGHPVYGENKFLGTVNLDIAVASESAFLASKNLHKGTYVIVNQDNEIIAASGLEGYSENEIFSAKELLNTEILETPVTGNKYVSSGNDYVYVKAFDSAPWKLYYLKNKLDVYSNSLYYVGLIFIVIILLFRVKTLIKRLSASRDELERQALTDPMTKLFNRRYLSEVTQPLLELMYRNSSELSVLLLDIDKFKHINDTYGHQIGDDVIIKLALVLQTYTRKSDIICRFGGEEFVILLPETTMDGALSLAEVLRREVEKLVMVFAENIELRFTISIGVSTVKKGEQTLDGVITRADNALYAAKESGRNKVCLKKSDTA